MTFSLYSIGAMELAWFYVWWLGEPMRGIGEMRAHWLTFGDDRLKMVRRGEVFGYKYEVLS